MRFNERLKQLRKNANLSQHQLAKEAGVPQTSINFYESGKRQPTIDVLVKFSQYFHVSADYLLGLVDEPQGDISPELKEKISKLEALEAENTELQNKIKKAKENLS